MATAYAGLGTRVDPSGQAEAMHESEFTLKATPPRLPRKAIERGRLQRYWNDVHDRTAIAVVAPAGFGKTVLMLQWRRRWLERGARVAWLMADNHDDPARFADAVLRAIREAGGRSNGRAGPADANGMEALTALLGGIAQQGVETVLVIDDAHRLPEPALYGPMQYLLLNAPPNLHLVFGSRLPLALPVAELAARGNLATLETEALRLRLEESIEILDKRLPRLGMDERAQLHEITEGWPLALQLAIAAVEHAPDPGIEVHTLSARHGTIQDYFAEALIAQRSPARADFLIRIAILEHLNADLCAALTGAANAAELLQQLALETPIVMRDERKDWMHLHALARDFLLARFEQLPAAERAVLHTRAARWLGDHQRFHEAARHALAAGDRQLAQSHAARSLWTLGTTGRYAEAREWIDHIPAEMFEEDLDLRLAAASILALSDRNAAALRIAREALENRAISPPSRAIALRLAAGAAAYADRLGLLSGLLARWPDHKESDDPLTAVSHTNSGALVALHAGATGKVRDRILQASRRGSGGSLRLAHALGQMLVGLSHLWDGNALQAEAVIRPALAKAERAGGRRGMIPSLYASVLAAALLEQDQLVAAQMLLANRLDVIERSGFPDNVLLAHRTLAYIALGQNDERRALNVLKNLEAVAERRCLPRLRAQALAEQIRLHALHGRFETVARLLPALEQMADDFEQGELRPFASQYRITAAIAHAYALLARRRPDEADRQLVAADALAGQLHRGRDALTIKALRAVVARQLGRAEASPLLQEALGLAAILGCHRLLADTHPLAVEMASQLPVTALGHAPAPDPAPIATGAARQGLLTSKEAEILCLLVKGMSNKLIARTLDISAETVKWHLKNLFLKLSTGSRKHAVDRARLLGLVQ